MTSPVITVHNISKHFLVPERESGLTAAMRSLLRPQRRSVPAVDDVSFEIAKGEVVGFLGPNGAGKSTTLKMLSGVLHPSSGDVRVLGYKPNERKAEYLRRIALLMGGRNQLMWDLPAADSFELQRAIYQIPGAEYHATLAELVNLLDINELIRKPVRNLSLGERMKVELVGALLHRPDVLLLDEPTLGLDLATQRLIRSFIEEYNTQRGATVLMTSHYMADIEALCQRVIVINGGQIVFDGRLDELSTAFGGYKDVEVAADADEVDLPGGRRGERRGGRVRLRVAREEVAEVTAYVLAKNAVTDLSISDPPIEDVIERVFASGRRCE